jgi:hypothetical protein
MVFPLHCIPLRFAYYHFPFDENIFAIMIVRYLMQLSFAICLRFTNDPKIRGEFMTIRTLVFMKWMIALFLLTSCTGSIANGPTSTPDPCSKEILETTVRDLEEFKNEMDGLAAEAADTPAEDLELIVRQMTALKEDIEEFEFPLCAAKVDSALSNFALSIEQCYFGKFAEVILDQDSMVKHENHCDQAQVYEETYNLLLQELNEMIAEE